MAAHSFWPNKKDDPTSLDRVCCKSNGHSNFPNMQTEHILAHKTKARVILSKLMKLAGAS